MGQAKTDTPEIFTETSTFTKSLNLSNISPGKTKEDERKYVCKYSGCSAAYSRQSRLDRHIRLHTGERPYKCDHPGCDKAYTNSSHLKRHVQTHNSVQKKLQCNKCFLTISNLHNLKRHYIRVHSDHNVLTCNECNAVFNRKRQLIHHMIKHFGSVSYKCGTCNKMYINLTRLKRHEISHEKGEKSYPCPMPQCSEVFNKWALLCKHKKTQHVNDYKCNQCGKQFSRMRWLTQHTKIHAEPKSFIPCPYDKCDRKYMYRSNLKNHIKIYHLNEKFTCDICKREFSSKRRLKEHIMRIHEGIKKERKLKQSDRKRRKDAGIPRKSMIKVLTGLKFDHHADKELLNRKYDI